MKLYTKTGDDGTTGLIGGGRIRKNKSRVSAYGEVDELNAVLGWCDVVLNSPLKDHIGHIQNMLFVIGAELATDPKNPPGHSIVHIDDAEVDRLEGWIDQASNAVAALGQFILPGGAEAGARLHVARAVCRRAERAIVQLADREPVRPVVLRYLNRLSDLLFAWARQANAERGAAETPWNPSNADHD